MDMERLSKMSYRELGDFLDETITEKLGIVNDPAAKDLYHHIRAYHRITSLMLNKIDAKAGIARNATIAIVKVLGNEKQRADITFLIDKMTQEHNEEILKEIEEANK